MARTIPITLVYITLKSGAQLLVPVKQLRWTTDKKTRNFTSLHITHITKEEFKQVRQLNPSVVDLETLQPAQIESISKAQEIELPVIDKKA